MKYAIDAAGVSQIVNNGAGQLAILQNLDLRVAAGASVAIIGRSGAGKTTLLSLLAGLDRPSAGRIALDGADLAGMDEEQRATWRAGRVGFVFQSFQLLEDFTALDNVRLAIELAGLDASRRRASEALDRVGLSGRLHHRPRQLSGGEKQRVALARAFAAQPSILFADEPTGNLDADTGQQIRELIFGLNTDHATTLVLVTHDRELAAHCQQQFLLADGRLAPA